MTLCIDDSSDEAILEIVDDDDETVVSLYEDAHGIVVHSRTELTDAGESVSRVVPVEFIADCRREFQTPEKYYGAIEQEITDYIRRNSNYDLHGVWSVSAQAAEKLREGDTV